MFQSKRTRKKSKRTPKKAHGQESKRLGIEALEPRILLSATWTDGDTGDPIAGPTEGNDVFDGGNANVDDVVNALGGDDILSGGGGEDTLSGGAGNDTIDGGNHDDTLYGDDGSDNLDGGAGDDTLYGGDGNDILSGGGAGNSGNDTLYGEAGNDTLTGGTGNDVLDGGAGDDTLQGDEGDDTLTGGDGNDVLDGGIGSDALAGGAGNDTLIGGKGNDALDGGTGIDTADYSNANAGTGVDVDLNAGTATGEGTDTLTNIENVTGSANDDTLTGDGGNNVLDGGAGDDTIAGGLGDDTLQGGTGDDTLQGGDGDDTLDGGDGTDTADYSDATAAVTVDLNAGTASGGAGNDTLTNIENVTGSANDDTITDDAGSNVLNAGAGDDTIHYTGGSDTISGQDGNDTVIIHSGQNGDVVNVDGGSGIDTIDLTAFDPNNINDTGSQVNVDLGGGDSFTINYTNVENILLAAQANQGPDAVDDSYNTTEGNAVTTGNVLGNDTDPENDTLSITGFTQGSNGTVVNNNDGTFTYTPDANFSGADSFTYTVDDGNGNTDTATVNMTVTPAAPPPNNGPDAVDDTYNTTEDNAVITGNVLGNDTDPENDALSITGFTQGSNGTVVNNNDGTFTYTPDAGFSGTDSFTYTIEDGNGGTDTATVAVSVAANPANNAPAGGPGPQSSPANSDSEDPDGTPDPQADADPHELAEDHDPLPDGDEPGFDDFVPGALDNFAPGALDEVETITLEPESQDDPEELVQANDVDHTAREDRVDLFDHHPDQPEANQAELGANDPDVFDMIMRGGKSAVPEFGNDDVAREFADAPNSEDGDHLGVGAWDPNDIEVIELAPEVSGVGEFGESETSFTDALGNGDGEFHRDDWNGEHVPSNDPSAGAAAAVATMPENQEAARDQNSATASKAGEPAGPMLQSLFPKVWAALAGIVGASHGPKLKDSASEDQRSHRRR